MVRYRRSNRTLEGKGHRRCLLWISKPARPGWSACIHQPRGILRSSRRLGRIASEMESILMGGDMSSYGSSWYWTYSSIRFYPSSSMREPKWNERIGRVSYGCPGICYCERFVPEAIFVSHDRGLV
ncbi:hypothetical protein Tco_0926373 [Tanacetum coccineum]|uniref:Uncharacterized protein n=1 Tax=Tanacetum coccineum TaxID=301880 RepID=A0ABQ5DFW8_9ASTR